MGGIILIGQRDGPHHEIVWPVAIRVGVQNDGHVSLIQDPFLLEQLRLRMSVPAPLAPSGARAMSRSVHPTTGQGLQISGNREQRLR